MEYILTLVSLSVIYVAYRLGHRVGYEQATADIVVDSIIDSLEGQFPETAEKLRKDFNR